LNAASVPIGDGDIETLIEFLRMDDGRSANPYVKCFVLLVLATIDLKSHRTIVHAEAKKLEKALRDQLDRPSEANYEYTMGNRQYYVRVPWQLYLVELMLRLHPSTIFFYAIWQKGLLLIAGAINSPEGFAYASSGLAQYCRYHSYVCAASTPLL
jgi:hypothetical protein